MNISFSPISFKRIATFGAVLLLVGVPLVASAVTVSGTINESSLEATSHKPMLSGTAEGTKRVRLTIHKEGSSKRFYRSKTIAVKDGKWKTRITKKLADGAYEVALTSSKASRSGALATEMLVIGDSEKRTARSNTTLAVSSIPLLFGGMVRAGTTIPVSYLQVTNVGKETAMVKGFSVEQNGSASAKSVIGLSAVDDKNTAYGSVGGIEGSTPFKDGKAFVPITTSLAPGEMRLFTIKAIMENNVAKHLGTQLKIDVVSVESDASTKAVFPIRGTTWTIGY